MPGTVHVSVLELVGLPSPPLSSSMGVKVSMGKQAHEMRDKEETSFPLASLRDNLNVSIHDFEGNEIAHTDVETRSIVEKVIWDDLFLLKGGGKIRMRIQFNLTEDEQNRIRDMRESAARKKHEDLLRRRHSSSGLASASGGSSASLQDSLKYRHKTEGRSVDLFDGQANKISAETNVKILKKAQAVQKKQVFSTSKSTRSLHNLAAHQHLEESDQGQEMEQQFQVNKTPSNVRKVILAFEKSPVKDESSATYSTRATAQTSSVTTVDVPSKPPSLMKTVAVSSKSVLFKLETLHTPEEIRKEREDFLLDTYKMTETSQLGGSNTRVNTPSKLPSLKTAITANTKTVLSKLELEKTSAPPTTHEELGKGRGELLPAPNITKEATLLRSTRDDTPSNAPVLKKIVAVNSEISDEKNVSNTLPAKEEHKEVKDSLKKLHTSLPPERSMFSLKNLLESLPKSTEFPTVLLNGKEGITASDPFVIEKKWRSKQWKSSECRAKPKLFYKNEHHAIDSWIFLDEMIGSCVLSGDNPFVDAHEGCLSICKQDNDQEKLTDSGVTQSKNEKDSVGSKKLESNRRRPNNASFTGPAGQVVKIVIMVGFGFLVFLTRQRK